MTTAPLWTSFRLPSSGKQHNKVLYVLHPEATWTSAVKKISVGTSSVLLTIYNQHL